LEKNLKVIAYTPMGKQQGQLRLNIEGSSVSGVLAIMGGEHAFSGGVLEGENISLNMKVKTPLGAVSAKARGTLKGESLNVSAKTRFGMFKLSTDN